MLSGLQYFSVRGSPPPKKDGPYLFMFNHESMFDVLMLAGGIPYYINAIGWEGVFKIPLFGYMAKRYGAYPITHDNTDKAKQTLKIAEKILLTDKDSMVLSPEERDKEASKSAKILGVKFRENMGFEDGFLVNDKSNQIEIVKKIRHYKPNIVLTCAQIDRHSDHGKASDLIYDSCFVSGLLKLKTSFDAKKQDPWRPQIILNYQQWNDFKPDVIVDISKFIKIKEKAILSFKSQVIKDDDTASTKINSENFLKSINYRAKNFGRLIDTDFAEIGRASCRERV